MEILKTLKSPTLVIVDILNSKVVYTFRLKCVSHMHVCMHVCRQTLVYILSNNGMEFKNQLMDDGLPTTWHQ